MRDDFCRLAESVRPLVLTAGNDAEDVNKWITNAVDELRNLSKHMYVNVSESLTASILLTDHLLWVVASKLGREEESGAERMRIRAPHFDLLKTPLQYLYHHPGLISTITLIFRDQFNRFLLWLAHAFPVIHKAPSCVVKFAGCPETLKYSSIF